MPAQRPAPSESAPVRRPDTKKATLAGGLVRRALADQITPCASMASATLTKPAMLAPAM